MAKSLCVFWYVNAAVGVCTTLCVCVCIPLTRIMTPRQKANNFFFVPHLASIPFGQEQQQPATEERRENEKSIKSLLF